jgi:hypothetical protein
MIAPRALRFGYKGVAYRANARYTRNRRPRGAGPSADHAIEPRAGILQARVLTSTRSASAVCYTIKRLEECHSGARRVVHVAEVFERECPNDGPAGRELGKKGCSRRGGIS